MEEKFKISGVVTSISIQVLIVGWSTASAASPVSAGDYAEKKNGNLIIAQAASKSGATQTVSKAGKTDGSKSKQKKPLKFQDLIKVKIENSKGLKTAALGVKSARAQVAVARAKWLPTLDLTVDVGHEDQVKPNAADTSEEFDELGIEIKQKLFDFGKTSNDVAVSKIAADNAQLAYQQNLQTTILTGLQVYTSLIAASEGLRFANASETRLKKAFGTEEFRVRRGSGLRSDLLQVRRQLAGARRTSLNAQLAFNSALDQFRTFYEINEVNVGQLSYPKINQKVIPKKLDGVIAKALKSPTSIQRQSSVKSARLAYENSKTTLWLPTFDLTLSAKRKDDVGGTVDRKNEVMAKVTMKYPLFTGGTHLIGSQNAYRSLETAQLSADDFIWNLKSQVRNQWRQYLNSQTNYNFASNEANIAFDFYKIVEKERAMNKRSVFELISAELAYYSAEMARNGARSGVVTSQAALLATMGELDVDHFNLK
ncbi:MAG: TolC family protein [Pseudomonadota bacterium]|nr:TolC family protein [Pseudomonadota bacterium]